MNSDSSASSSPMVLTPDSTGTRADNSPDSTAAAKKTRRQTAFYPNNNSANKIQKPFSRSAAKRESVMALGSIEHLQHYFTKTGIAAKKNPLDKPHHGLVPAIGGRSHVRVSPSIGSNFELPPSPAIPQPSQPPFSPHVAASDIDPDHLLPGVVEDLSSVADAWQIGTNAQTPTDVNNLNSRANEYLDVLEVLKLTTRAVRSIRNYLLSLPDESAGTIRAHFRPKLLGPGKFQANVPPSPTQPDPLSLIRKSALEVLTVLRELEERCRLPLLDDAYDAQSDGGGSRGGTRSHLTSPAKTPDELPIDESSTELEIPIHSTDSDASIIYSLVQIQGRYQTIPVWEDEEDEFQQGEEKEKPERWDERLVVGSGWLYRRDIKLEDLEKERKVVIAYLDVVDEVLFEWKREEGKERGWERERRKALGKGDSISKAKARRVSAVDGEGFRGLGMLPTPLDSGKRRVSTPGMLESVGRLTLDEEPEGFQDIPEDEGGESVDDDDLPAWAQRNSFDNDDLGRAHALLSAFLPSNLLYALQLANSRTEFLSSLSSGQLLCIAYNACVRKSKHPWGYVNRDSVHDILALEKADKEGEERGKKGWTFRRTDNLRLWVGALKLRYMLPLLVPSQSLVQASGIGTPIPNPSTPLGSPIRSTYKHAEPPIIFDAKVVAKKEQGWEDMLEAVLLKWVSKVVEEKRDAR